MTDCGTVQMRRSSADPSVCWIHRAADDPPFDPAVFDVERVDGDLAAAGRGNTRFIDWQGVPLVRREYRRGGLIRHLSERHYLAIGLERSRPLREFRLLCALEQLGLPVSRAYAACRRRQGPFETGALITHRVPGETLAKRVQACDGQLLSPGSLEAVGQCIARFHAAGVWHADLNAHNVMIDGDGGGARVSLIDFDRSTLTSDPARDAPGVGARRNLQRLHRSVDKLIDATVADEMMGTLEGAWRSFWPVPSS